MKQKMLIFILFGVLITACTQYESPIDSTSNIKELPTLVTLEDAIKKGESLYKELYGTTRSERIISSVEFLKPTSTRSANTDEFNGFYLVNYEEDCGFCLLSADNRTEAVYAISDTGNLELSDTLQNESLSWYLNQAAFELAHNSINNKTNGISLPVDTMSQGGSTTIIRNPLLKGFMTKFSQHLPYNKYCFTTDGKQAVVGCVPLAVGTIMGYYKWPTNYKGYTFDWISMSNNQNDESWARLFNLIGNKENCNSKYGENGTSTYEGNVVNAFSNMGYKNVNYSKYSSAIVNSNLKYNSLIYVEGPAKNTTGGHGWVIDGAFQKNFSGPPIEMGGKPVVYTYLYYHCVWGWGGKSNGYYYLDNNTLGGSPERLTESGTDCCKYTFYDMKICYGMTK